MPQQRELCAASGAKCRGCADWTDPPRTVEEPERKSRTGSEPGELATTNDVEPSLSVLICQKQVASSDGAQLTRRRGTASQGVGSADGRGGPERANGGRVRGSHRSRALHPPVAECRNAESRLRMASPLADRLGSFGVLLALGICWETRCGACEDVLLGSRGGGGLWKGGAAKPLRSRRRRHRQVEVDQERVAGGMRVNRYPDRRGPHA